MSLGAVTRNGDGLVATAVGRVVLADAFAVLAEAMAGDPCPTHVVIDFSHAGEVAFSLEDVHTLARHIRGSEELRGQRHAFVAASPSARAHVANYEYMVTEMMNWWGDDPVEVAVFTSLDDALAWGSTGVRPTEA